jgi:hypothetical protein
MPLMTISGKSRLLSPEFRTEAHHRCRVAEEGLYVCLLHYHFIENHSIWILEDGPLISEVVLSQLVSELDQD